MQTCAVIGCGPAGMVAAAHTRRLGLMTTCFELAPDPGGIWNTGGADARSPRGLLAPIHGAMRCVLPKDLMAFSDLRFDYDVPHFPHHTAVRNYLQQYAERTGVYAQTRFDTTVESVRRCDAEGTWKLVSVNVRSGAAFEWSFDRVVVCTGQTHAPRFPASMPWREGFVDAGGTVEHAAFAKCLRDFRSKVVIVVGDGVGAYDLCCELVRHGARSVVHSSLQLPVEGASPLSLDGIERQRRRHQRGAGGLASALWTSAVATLPFLRTSAHRSNELLSLWLRSYAHEVLRVRRVGALLEAHGRRLVARDLADGAPVMLPEADAVLLATGYERRYPFLPDDIREELERPALPLVAAGDAGQPSAAAASVPAYDRRSLYFGVVHARYPSLAFVGLQRDLLPPFLLFEAQARFAASLLSGAAAMPATVEEQLRREDACVQRSPGLASLYRDAGLGLDSIAYFDALHQELGFGRRINYMSALAARRPVVTRSLAVSAWHRCKSLAPLKRKQQHVLFSNKI